MLLHSVDLPIVQGHFKYLRVDKKKSDDLPWEKRTQKKCDFGWFGGVFRQCKPPNGFWVLLCRCECHITPESTPNLGASVLCT